MNWPAAFWRDQSRIAEEIARDMVGYGPLEPLLADDSINDIGQRTGQRSSRRAS